MALEAIEEIKVIGAQLRAEIFNPSFAKIQVLSGAIANLYCIMALTTS